MELDARPGGWTLPSTPEPAYRAQVMLKQDRQRKNDMRTGLRYRGKPILIIKPHIMKGRRGRVEDDHDILMPGTGERRAVLTVRVENSPQTWQVPEEQALHLWYEPCCVKMLEN